MSSLAGAVVVLVQLLGRFLLLGPEPEEQEKGVEDEGDGDGQDGVHEQLQLHVLEAVLLQPLQHVDLLQQVV